MKRIISTIIVIAFMANTLSQEGLSAYKQGYDSLRPLVSISKLYTEIETALSRHDWERSSSAGDGQPILTEEAKARKLELLIEQEKILEQLVSIDKEIKEAKDLPQEHLAYLKEKKKLLARLLKLKKEQVKLIERMGAVEQSQKKTVASKGSVSGGWLFNLLDRPDRDKAFQALIHRIQRDTKGGPIYYKNAFWKEIGSSRFYDDLQADSQKYIRDFFTFDMGLQSTKYPHVFYAAKALRDFFDSLDEEKQRAIYESTTNRFVLSAVYAEKDPAKREECLNRRFCAAIALSVLFPEKLHEQYIFDIYETLSEYIRAYRTGEKKLSDVEFITIAKALSYIYKRLDGIRRNIFVLEIKSGLASEDEHTKLLFAVMSTYFIRNVADEIQLNALEAMVSETGLDKEDDKEARFLAAVGTANVWDDVRNFIVPGEAKIEKAFSILLEDGLMSNDPYKVKLASEALTRFFEKGIVENEHIDEQKKKLLELLSSDKALKSKDTKAALYAALAATQIKLIASEPILEEPITQESVKQKVEVEPAPTKAQEERMAELARREGFIREALGTAEEITEIEKQIAALREPEKVENAGRLEKLRERLNHLNELKVCLIELIDTLDELDKTPETVKAEELLAVETSLPEEESSGEDKPAGKQKGVTSEKITAFLGNIAENYDLSHFPMGAMRDALEVHKAAKEHQKQLEQQAIDILTDGNLIPDFGSAYFSKLAMAGLTGSYEDLPDGLKEEIKKTFISTSGVYSQNLEIAVAVAYGLFNIFDLAFTKQEQDDILTTLKARATNEAIRRCASICLAYFPDCLKQAGLEWVMKDFLTHVHTIHSTSRIRDAVFLNYKDPQDTIRLTSIIDNLIDISGYKFLQDSDNALDPNFLKGAISAMVLSKAISLHYKLSDEEKDKLRVFYLDLLEERIGGHGARCLGLLIASNLCQDNPEDQKIFYEQIERIFKNGNDTEKRFAAIALLNAKQSLKPSQQENAEDAEYSLELMDPFGDSVLGPEVTALHMNSNGTMLYTIEGNHIHSFDLATKESDGVLTHPGSIKCIADTTENLYYIDRDGVSKRLDLTADPGSRRTHRETRLDGYDVLASYQGTVWAAGHEDGKVCVFPKYDAFYEFNTSFEFESPVKMAATEDRLYVAEAPAGQQQRIKAIELGSDDCIRNVSLENTIILVDCVDMAVSNGVIYVLDKIPQASPNAPAKSGLRLFDAETGKSITFSNDRLNPNAFNKATGIAAHNDTVYVVSSNVILDEGTPDEHIGSTITQYKLKRDNAAVTTVTPQSPSPQHLRYELLTQKQKLLYELIELKHEIISLCDPYARVTNDSKLRDDKAKEQELLKALEEINAKLVELKEHASQQPSEPIPLPLPIPASQSSFAWPQEISPAGDWHRTDLGDIDDFSKTLKRIFGDQELVTVLPYPSDVPEEELLLVVGENGKAQLCDIVSGRPNIPVHSRPEENKLPGFIQNTPGAPPKVKSVTRWPYYVNGKHHNGAFIYLVLREVDDITIFLVSDDGHTAPFDYPGLRSAILNHSEAIPGATAPIDLSWRINNIMAFPLKDEIALLVTGDQSVVYMLAIDKEGKVRELHGDEAALAKSISITYAFGKLSDIKSVQYWQEGDYSLFLAIERYYQNAFEIRLYQMDEYGNVTVDADLDFTNLIYYIYQPPTPAGQANSHECTRFLSYAVGDRQTLVAYGDFTTYFTRPISAQPNVVEVPINPDAGSIEQDDEDTATIYTVSGNPVKLKLPSAGPSKVSLRAIDSSA